MTTLLTVLFGLVFFMLLMASVALHEVGHMLPAKAFGVKVPKYFVGFGKTLWSIRRGETEYGLKLFPLGGFVQLLGMYPPRHPDARDSRLQRLADGARDVEWEDITDADRGRLFYERSTPKKLVIMAGGITMNLLIAFLLLWGVAGLHGSYQAQPVVASVQDCVLPQARAGSPCLASDPASPAKLSGLNAGDRIVEFNGTPIADYASLTALIRANGGGEVRIVVERAGVRTPLVTVHTLVNWVSDPLDPNKLVQAGWFGVRPQVALVRSGPVQVLSDMGTMTAQSVVALAQFPVKTFNVMADLVTGKPRDITGPISIVGASTVAGEVATAEASVGDKVAMFASLLASVNLFLAVFNLVPLPPLDGGHIAGALYDGARRRIAKLRGKPDPGPADTAKMLPVAYAVGAFLLVCGVALIIADVLSPIKLF